MKICHNLFLVSFSFALYIILLSLTVRFSPRPVLAPGTAETRALLGGDLDLIPLVSLLL